MMRFLWGAVKFFLILGALAAVVGIAFLLTLRFATTVESVAVPDLVGLDPPTAIRALNPLGLGIQFEEDEKNAFDDEIPAGHVLRQTPAPGTFLKKSRKVKVSLSLGSRRLFVPRVVGEPVTTAQVRIQEAGLGVGDLVYVSSYMVPENVVIDQEPVRLDESVASSVSLLVSSGRPPGVYVMPDLIGKPQLRLQALLELSGYRVKVQSEVYEGIPEGRIVRQKPLAGYSIRAGDPVWLWVSQRPAGR